MARAVVDTEPNSGTVHLTVNDLFAGAMHPMFVSRDELKALTPGERALGCPSCMLHQMDDPAARPAVVDGATVSDEVKAMLDAPMQDESEVFLLCPILAVTAAARAARNLPCQTIGLMPIANT